MISSLFQTRVQRQQDAADRLCSLHEELLRLLEVSCINYSSSYPPALRQVASFLSNAVNKPTTEPKSTEVKEEESAANKPPLVVSVRASLPPEYLSACLSLAATRTTHSYSVPTTPDEKIILSVQSLERVIVSIIRKIGELVVTSQNQQEHIVRSGPYNRAGNNDVFDYFCERSILTLFVQVVSDKPAAKPLLSSSHLHSIVWSPHVKAQTLHTVAVLVSSLRTSSALYYILSQHSINQLVTTLLPLEQWNDSALELMLPAYVDLLKHLSLRLGSSPHLFPLFTVQGSKPQVAFPLFSALVETAKSGIAQSDSFIHATCLNLIVSLMQIEDSAIEEWIRAAANWEHGAALANHVGDLLVRQFYRIADVCTGPVVDPRRSDVVVIETAKLQDQMRMLNDLFLCNIHSFNIRICETVLQRLVRVLFRHMLPPLLEVGSSDADVIPEREARANTAVFVLSQLFQLMDYNPINRMLAVAIFHPRSLAAWSDDVEDGYAGDDLPLTRGLNKLATSTDNGENIENPYRVEVLKSLCGGYGEWRFATASLLVEQLIRSEAIDADILRTLHLFPDPDHTNESLKNALERLWKNETLSSVTIRCSSSLLCEIVCSLLRGKGDRETAHQFRDLAINCRDSYYRQLVSCRDRLGVSELFLDLLENSIKSRYKRHTKGATGNQVDYVFHLNQHDSRLFWSGYNVLVREHGSASLQDRYSIESCRIYTDTAVHMRGICRIIERLLSEDLDETSEKDILVDVADDLTIVFSSLQDPPSVGAEVDLRGRTTFPFFSVCNDRSAEQDEDSSPPYVLVLDPTTMTVVRGDKRSTRGAVECCVPLLKVIAAAVDDDTLHIAVQHPDTPNIIQNGNMTLRFASSGGGLIVQKYLDRTRHVLREDLVQKVMLEWFGDVSSSSQQA